MDEMQGRIEELQRRLERLEKRVDGHMGPDRTARVVVPPPPRRPSETLAPVPAPGAGKDSRGDTDAAKGRPAGVPRRLITTELELKLGRQWLSRLGVAAVVLGAVFFQGYAFQNNLIGNLGRVVIGLFFGLAMLVAGEIFQRKRLAGFGQGLSAGGIAILYASIYTAGNVYHLIGHTFTFGFLSVVTVLSAVLALRYDSHIIAVQGLLAGFLNPVLLSGGGDGQGPGALIAYLAILDAGLLCIALLRRWHYIAPACLALTTLLLLAWSGEDYRASFLAPTLTGITILFLLFCAYFAASVLRCKPAGHGDMLLLGTAAFIHYIACYKMLSPLIPAFMGLVTLIPALFFLALGLPLLRFKPDDRLPGVFTLGLSLTFTTIAMPVQFKLHFLTIAWAVEGALVIWMGLRFGTRWLRLSGLGMLGLVFLRLLFLTRDLSPGRLPFLGAAFLTTAAAIVLFYISALLLRRGVRMLSPREKTAPETLLVAANILFTLAVSREIIDWGAVFTGDYTAGINPLLSLVWGINAAVLILRRRGNEERGLSWTGWILLALAGVLAFHQSWLMLDASFHWLHLAAPLLLAAAVLALAPDAGALSGGSRAPAAWIRLAANILILFSASLAIAGSVGAGNILACLILFWNVYTLVLLTLARRRQEPEMPATAVGGLCLLTLATVMTFYNAAVAPREIALFNLVFAGALSTVFLLGWTGYVIHRMKWPGTAPTAPMPAILANVLALWLFSCELRRWGMLSGHEQLAAALISPVWAVHAAVLVAYGMTRLARSLRLTGLSVFCLTCLKVLLVDMSGVAIVFRSLTLAGLGLFLLLASYLYQRFGNRTPEGEEEVEA